MTTTAVVLLVSLAVGCGRGGGGSAQGPATPVGTSLLSATIAPGAVVPLLPRNRAIEVRFSRSIDATNFGGFIGGATPTIFTAATDELPGTFGFFAFSDQAAARQAVVVFEDATQAPVTNVVVGRRVDDPATLVVSPVVPDENPWGLTATAGWATTGQKDVFIPAQSALSAGGVSVAPFGSPPPVPTVAPGALPSAFLVSPFYAPDFSPPTVLSITTIALAGQDPATTAIPQTDVIVVRFSEPVDPASLRLTDNVIVRNKSSTSIFDPLGHFVPVTAVFSTSGRTLFLTPQPSFGAGPDRIEVTIVPTADPGRALSDLPSYPIGGVSRLVNSSTIEFTTVPGGNVDVAAFIEDFDDPLIRDPNFVGRYNDAVWTPSAGRVEGLPISGQALPGGPLGTRMQFAIQPNFPVPVLSYATLFNDFNGNLIVPPIGPLMPVGTHNQFLYAANGNELPLNFSDTVELVEWRTSGLANPPPPVPATYNGFTMRMSHTTSNPVGTFGLVTFFNSNFDFDNPQNALINPTAHPGGLPLNETPVVVIPTQPYVVPAIVSQYVPFPTLALPFDFVGERVELNALSNAPANPSLLVDIDIPGPIGATGNFLLGNFPSAPIPLRFLTSPSFAGQTTATPVAAFSGNQIMHMRFTLVGKNSSGRTSFIDLSPIAAEQVFTSFSLLPDIRLRPPGSTLVVTAEAADAVAGQEPIFPTPIVTLIDRSGTLDTTALSSLSGNRFIRFTFEYESALGTNMTPSIDRLALGFTY